MAANFINWKFVPHSLGELHRGVDPTGEIVEHHVRRSTYVHERRHNLTGPQKLADELYDTAGKWRLDFERAQLSGSYARLGLFKVRSGRHEMSNNVAMAKVRIDKALDALRQWPLRVRKAWRRLRHAPQIRRSGTSALRNHNQYRNNTVKIAALSLSWERNVRPRHEDALPS